jgi:hypothetical protein
MLCFAEESAVEAQGPALHKLNELYATWWGLPETQTLANGLLQRLRQHQQPASAESSGTLRLELLPEAAQTSALGASPPSSPGTPQRSPRKAKSPCNGFSPTGLAFASPPRHTTPLAGADSAVSPVASRSPTTTASSTRSPGPSPPAASLLAMSVDDPTGGDREDVSPPPCSPPRTHVSPRKRSADDCRSPAFADPAGPRASGPQAMAGASASAPESCSPLKRAAVAPAAAPPLQLPRLRPSAAEVAAARSAEVAEMGDLLRLHDLTASAQPLEESALHPA